MTFPASTNAGAAQPGPFYGCLGSQPNPAWFFMQIANSGSISIAMAAASDIDFICWGPFPSLATACSSLTSGNVQSCSYSGSPTETCTIASAVAGQFYLMLITNFSNQVQNITFNQNNANTSGAGSTNCGFVCVVTATTSGLICAGQSATVALGVGSSTSVNSYTWSGPGAFTSTLSANVFTNVLNNATYSVIASNSAIINGAAYSGTCSAAVTVSVLQYPTFSVTPTTTNICQGGNFFAGVTFTPPVSSTLYSYNWAPYSGAGVWQPSSVTTLIAPNLLPPGTITSTVVYSVTVWPTSTVVTCAVTKTLAVTINNPLTPTITTPPYFCDTFSSTQLIAVPGGGTWSANPAPLSISSGGLFTPSLAIVGGTNSVSYAVSVGTCNVSKTTTVSVSKFYTPALTSSLNTVCVQDPAFNLMNIVQSTVTGIWSGLNVVSNLFNPGGLASGNYNLTYNTTSLPNPTVCPASTVLVVPVFNPPIPLISTINPRCTNEGTMALTATPPNGLWSGSSGISALGIQTPTVFLNSLGTNTVTYSAGLGTCVASSSKTFHVSRFNTAALTGTIANLCVSSAAVNLMSIVQNTNGSWAGYGINGTNIFSPAGVPTNTYNLVYSTVSTPSLTLCPDSRTIAVSVLNPPTPNITQVGPYCNTSAPVQLLVSPSTGSWTASSFLSSNGVFTPSLSSVGANGVQYVIGTSTCNSQQTKLISTEAFVSAVMISNISDQCNTNAPLNLSPFTLNNSGTWSGAGIAGNTFNPAISGAGTFTLTYQTASSPSGLCPDQSSTSVQVYSLAIPAITKAGPYCNNAPPVQLKVSPVGGIFGGNSIGVVSSGGLFNPALCRIGDNNISYSISAGPCIANAQTIISIEKFISAAFDKQPESVYCKTTLPFNLNSFVQNPGGNWSSTSPGIVGNNMFDPSLANSGSIIIYYQTNSAPLGLCPDLSTVQIAVKNTPVVTATASILKGCAPLQVSFNSTSDPGKGVWNISDGTSQTGLNSNYIFTSAGSYSVLFSYTDGEAFGCSAQVVLKNPVVVYETPKADFSYSPEEITIADPVVKFTNLSEPKNALLYNWKMEGIDQENEVNPIVTFPKVGNYKITLTASSVNQCTNEVSRIIQIKNDFYIFIPNAFSPNFDGLNDVFIPVFSPFGLDQKSFVMEIFDRWGHQLFSTKDLNKGWDGTIQNKQEEIAKDGSYIYKIKYKDLEGNLYFKNGNVTLLR